jgi:hypothetical protein
LLNRILPPLAAAVIAATPALAQDTEIQFALDWRFEGPSAPYFLAIDNGYFAEQGLSVEVTAGQGSLDAIPKVASGAFPMGFADINSLIRFLDQNPGAPVTAVMMTYDSPPFAIVGRVSQGISGIEDLEGSTLGAPPPDGAWAQFPILAAVNDIDVSTITTGLRQGCCIRRLLRTRDRLWHFRGAGTRSQQFGAPLLWRRRLSPVAWTFQSAQTGPAIDQGRRCCKAPTAPRDLVPAGSYPEPPCLP